MSAIDDFLENVEPRKRKELERIRVLARAIVPSAQETIAYNMPTLTYEGKAFLGFNAHARHIGIYPYSGQVIPQLKDEFVGYAVSKSAIRVPLNQPISKRLLQLVIACRLEAIRTEIGSKRGRIRRRRTTDESPVAKAGTVIAAKPKRESR
jgi:uncharacterized protein YdhG (YjbR/CyaY superfamily)